MPASADRAMFWLRKSIAGGNRDLSLFHEDPDLDSLRDRHDFKLLIIDLAFPSKPVAR